MLFVFILYKTTVYLGDLLSFHIQGYSRDASFLEMVVDIIRELKKTNPSLVYGEFNIGHMGIHLRYQDCFFNKCYFFVSFHCSL